MFRKTFAECCFKRSSRKKRKERALLLQSFKEPEMQILKRKGKTSDKREIEVWMQVGFKNPESVWEEEDFFQLEKEDGRA